MSSDRFPDIGAVVSDSRFPPMDTALRRGKHIHRDMVDDYEWLLEAQDCLEPFYQRYGCELVHRSEGYFFLLPVSDAMASRQMSLAEMVVGQGLALCYLDPAALEGGGVIAREELLGKLASVMGPDVLMQTFNAKKKRLDERVAQKVVRQKVAEGLRKLSALGFVEVIEGERLKLRPSLMRFAEPVRGMPDAQEAMKALITKGEVSSEDGEIHQSEAVDSGPVDRVEAEAELPASEALEPSVWSGDSQDAFDEVEPPTDSPDVEWPVSEPTAENLSEPNSSSDEDLEPLLGTTELEGESEVGAQEPVDLEPQS